NLWQHTTSILVSLLALCDAYPDVGIASLSYHDFALPEQTRMTTAGFGAANPKNKRVIGTIHIDRHGVAFLVDKT
ncbi:hypothetical protein PHYSODRAFT_373571, partial [Phytophthora sojae]